MLRGSEIKRLIKEYSGLVLVLRFTGRGLQKAGYLFLRRGRVESYSLAGATSPADAIRMISEDESFFLSVRISAKQKGVELLEKLDGDALRTLEGFE